LSDSILVAGKLGQPNFTTRIDEDGIVAYIAPEFPDLPPLGFRLDCQMELEKEEGRLNGLESYLAFNANSESNVNWAKGKIAECIEHIKRLQMKINAKKHEIESQQFMMCCLHGGKFAASKGFVWACGNNAICYDCMGEKA